MIENFVGVFPNAVSEEYCQRCIAQFEFINKGLPGRGGRVLSRQELEPDVPQQKKDSDVYLLCEEVTDSILLTKTDGLLQEFDKAVWECYAEYAKKYGILNSLARHIISPYIKIQRYKPPQGYHIWHDEQSGANSANRLLVVALYLNTVEEGGETEFLYQHKRVKAEKGNILIFTASFTHTHRGNPPISGDKYILTGWWNLFE